MSLTGNRYGLSMQGTWRADGGMATIRACNQSRRREDHAAAFGAAIRRRKDRPRSSLSVEIQSTLSLPW